MSSARALCGSRAAENPLDATSVHPESYEAVEELFAKLGMTTEQILGWRTGGCSMIKDYKKLAEELENR